ncbi:hypothetical protein A1O1_01058 [Capronia coronata CBS 617.96]|uniref:Uncharacterized protein n=1 Tax=Capronia coronata CBS 617.96 TaxID=1182541 RepID=W9YTU6_9EURO|nr:uncharacterized protein A1O1_01058 [Capronia coronata CBS 617.96]EXJ95933.1 hypothetical protein A1O1_01058 [Capronia coronata CBS 617.96]
MEQTVEILNSQSSPKHSWSSEERLLLAIINKVYDQPIKEVSLIFNSICHNQLAKEGISNGLSISTIRAQIADLKRTPRVVQEYQHVQSMSLDIAHKVFRQQRRRIETAAESLGISLKPRLYQVPTPAPTKRSYIARDTDWDDESDISDGPEASTYKTQGKPGSLKKKMALAPRSSVLSWDTEEEMRNMEVASPQDTDTSIGSVSSYTDSDSSASWCTQSDSEDTQQYFQETGQNDFSISASRMDARLRISFDYRGRPTKKHPRLLFRAFEPAYGLNLEKVGESVSTHLSLERRPGYTGIGEFLSWGSVTGKPVAILGKGAALNLYHAFKGIRGVGYDSGVVIGQVIVSEVDRASGPAYRDFVDGVYDVPGHKLPESDSGAEGQVFDDDWEPASHLDDPQTTRFKAVRQAHITVEIPSITMKSNSQTASGSETNTHRRKEETEEDLQSLVDSQLAQTGLEFGITALRGDTSSPPASTEGDNSRAILGEDFRSNSVNLLPRWSTMATTLQGDSMTVEKSDYALGPKDDFDRFISREQLDSDPRYDAFMAELLKFAKLPTPAPPSPLQLPTLPSIVTASSPRSVSATAVPGQNPVPITLPSAVGPEKTSGHDRESPLSPLRKSIPSKDGDGDHSLAISRPGLKSVQRTLTEQWSVMKGTTTTPTVDATAIRTQAKNTGPKKNQQQQQQQQQQGATVPVVEPQFLASNTTTSSERSDPVIIDLDAGSQTPQGVSGNRAGAPTHGFRGFGTRKPARSTRTKAKDNIEIGSVIEISDNDDLEIIATTTRLHARMRRTVLTIRSRSLSEAVVLNS